MRQVRDRRCSRQLHNSVLVGKFNRDLRNERAVSPVRRRVVGGRANYLLVIGRSAISALPERESLGGWRRYSLLRHRDEKELALLECNHQ